jgi:putative glycerol-1-phosphate prenyltransferase
MLSGGSVTSAEYFTQTIALPRNKPEILKTLGLTANYLGLEGIYLEAGSGAQNPITPDEVRAVVEGCELPVLAGGGLRTRGTCEALFNAGATGLIVGTAIEETKSLSWLEDL